MALLDLDAVCLHIGGTPILDGLSLSVDRGEVVGLVGESGSGKSMTALSVLRLLPHGARLSGRILFDGRDIAALDEAALCALRGNEIGMVFQEPMTALNPVRTVGDQVAESLICHGKANRAEARRRAADLLARVGLPAERQSPERFPHQLSGGQRQRVVIAMAIACGPKLLIADEPTTALDVTIQAQILTLLKDIVRAERMGLLLISHDLAVVADMAERVAIMKDGAIVETGPTAALFRTFSHPYSRRLFEASGHVPVRAPVPAAPATGAAQTPLLSVEGLECRYPLPRDGLLSPRRHLRAVDGVSFSLGAGESLGLVGESGCGKSTLARALLGLQAPSQGTIRIGGRDPYASRGAALKALRKDVQVVFQDPYGSFDPRHRIARTIGEPLHLLPALTAAERRERVAEALVSVGLSARDGEKYPHEFSGGQRQRIAIARALVTEPKLIVADEPVSALDMSIRAQILDLFADLQARFGLAYLFISHDLAVVRAITEKVMVMNAGRIVERGATQAMFDAPEHPYTRLLVASAPDLEASLRRREAQEAVP
ncbi:ABC transporter ATP-binding protein [Polymorphum gilvum]|uniref:ABC peptide transporter, fused ATPase domains n=1 Tax=Polymorphum gilvum (strain LMG 25793 / CGMCC 1.9160 / SL003B-26A1) TaxID=991905 RepID=F2J6D4_POLGS|nr:dipeptide ABC transporter ATP-binding protein [Polymorphum gilvum]ADZ71308.1 ABC peptide transporter, fused ATPase domains [Polymorphum gilvum SL003B-26A1]